MEERKLSSGPRALLVLCPPRIASAAGISLLTHGGRTAMTAQGYSASMVISTCIRPSATGWTEPPAERTRVARSGGSPGE